MTSTLLMRLAYVASHSSHQWTPVEINPILNADAAAYDQSATYLQSASTYKVGCIASCYTQPITEANMGGNGSYNSLQVSAEQRMRSGLTLLANYTWSKAIDNTPYNQSSTAIASGNSYVLPIYEPNFKRLDHGPSDFDHRNVASISYVYMFPECEGCTGWGSFLVNGWQTSGLFQTTQRRSPDNCF